MTGHRLQELERRVAGVLHGDIPEARRPTEAGSETPSAHAVRIVLGELRMEVPYDSCSIQELRGRQLVIVAGVGFADLDVLLGESFDIDARDVPNGEVVHRKRPLIVSDTEKYRAFRRGLHVGAGVRAWLGVPMKDGGGMVVGVLALDKAEPDFYTQEHADIAQQYASVLARVLETESRRGELAG